MPVGVFFFSKAVEAGSCPDLQEKEGVAFFKKSKPETISLEASRVKPPFAPP